MARPLAERMRFDGMRVLVTGATGFVGANLVRRLLELGAEVHCIVRRASRTHRIDEVRDDLVIHLADVEYMHDVMSAMQKSKPTIVYNLAMTSGHPSTLEERLQFLNTGFLGAVHLIEAAAATGCERIIQAGSSTEYGPRGRALRETDPLHPITPRGMSKAAATLLYQQFARSQRLATVILRLFSCYGYWEDETRLIPTVIRSALDGGSVDLTPQGLHHDYVFVEDVVDAFTRAAQNDKAIGETINIGSGQQYANEEVVSLVSQIMKRDIPVNVGAYQPRPLDTSTWKADISKARRILAWEPHHAFREGLKKTIDWFTGHYESHDTT